MRRRILEGEGGCRERDAVMVQFGVFIGGLDEGGDFVA